jgi:hypothetical protein
MITIKRLFLAATLGLGLSSFGHAADFPLEVTQGFIRSYIDVSGATITINTPQALISAGTTVYIQADAPPARMTFDQWSATPPLIPPHGNTSSTMLFKMPASALKVQASYRKFRMSVNGDLEVKYFFSGEPVTVIAPPFPAPNVRDFGFSLWLHVPQMGADGLPVLDDKGKVKKIQVYTSTITFTMPNEDVALVAGYALHQNLTVVDGTGSGRFVSLQFQTIVADPAPTGKVFDRWVCNVEGIKFTDARKETTQVQMGNVDITVTATYTDPVFALPGNPNDGFIDFPNVLRPGSGGTMPIAYFLNSPSSVSLKIYDVRGYLVRELTPTATVGTTNTVLWDGRNDDGRLVATDIYFVLLKINGTLYKNKVSIIN